MANAGNDVAIILPLDSVLVDGSGSYDADGVITSYHWSRIGGPVSHSFVQADSAKTRVRLLHAGVYQFQLKVTDNKGAVSTDTMRVMVGDYINRPPVACAGPDQTVTYPATSVSLNGGCSADPDNNLTQFEWKYVSGPGGSVLSNAFAAQTVLSNLVAGIYTYELKVTDAAGLFSSDTVLVTSFNTGAVACNVPNRPLIPSTLTVIGALSQARANMAVTAVGNKIFFVGGVVGNVASNRVDIFDISSNTSITTQLVTGRNRVFMASLGTKIFIAGDDFTSNNSFHTVEVYDISGNTWSVMNLPGHPNRGTVVNVAAVANKVVFLSTTKSTPAPSYFTYTLADIYDVTSGVWRTDTLQNRTHAWPNHSASDAGISTTVVGNKIYFAGNASDWWLWDFGSISGTVNIYDGLTDSWTAASELNQPRGYMASALVGNKIIWAGGIYKQPDDPFSRYVEIFDVVTGTTAIACLFQPNAFFDAAKRDNVVVFFTSAEESPSMWSVVPPVHNKFDIYNASTNIWSIGTLSSTVRGASIISVNNTFYIGGGYLNGVLSNHISKLQF